MLYLYYNATVGVPPPSDGSILATQVKWLFNITGSMENPVTDITIRGLGLRDTAYTYMDPHGIPSGKSFIKLRVTICTGLDDIIYNNVSHESVIFNDFNQPF